MIEKRTLQPCIKKRGHERVRRRQSCGGRKKRPNQKRYKPVLSHVHIPPLFEGLAASLKNLSVKEDHCGGLPSQPKPPSVQVTCM